MPQREEVSVHICFTKVSLEERERHYFSLYSASATVIEHSCCLKEYLAKQRNEISNGTSQLLFFGILIADRTQTLSSDRYALESNLVETEAKSSKLFCRV